MVSSTNLAAAYPAPEPTGLDFHARLRLATLRALADGVPHHASEIEALVVRIMPSAAAQRGVLTEAGEARLPGALRLAVHHLQAAGLAQQVAPATSMITRLGADLLASGMEALPKAILHRYPAWCANQGCPVTRDHHRVSHAEADLPNEYAALRPAEVADVLRPVLALDPAEFAGFVGTLLQHLGYGRVSVLHVGRDGGVDGYATPDPLGLWRIPFQAKRLDPARTISEETVRAFAGALEPMGARAGVFITTASFSWRAVRYTSEIAASPKRLVLVGGSWLAELIRENDGVVVPGVRP